MFRTVAEYKQSLSLPHIRYFRMTKSLMLLHHHLRYPTHGLCENFAQASGASHLRNYSKKYIGKVLICKNHEHDKKHILIITKITYRNNNYFSLILQFQFTKNHLTFKKSYWKMTVSSSLSKSSTEGLSRCFHVKKLHENIRRNAKNSVTKIKQYAVAFKQK